MATLDNQQLEQLMSEEKWEDAKVLLENYFSAEADSKDPGEGYVQLAQVYMEVMNNLNSQYEKVLDEAIDAAKELTRTEKGIMKELDMAEVRNRIKGSSID